MTGEMFPELPTDPVELAAFRAEQSITQGDASPHGDQLLLAELDHGAEELGFTNQTYLISAYRSFVLPRTFRADQAVSYDDIPNLLFEGRFATYAKIEIGQLIGKGAVRAVCLTFDQSMLLPYFDELPEDKLLFVPVLAVETIAQT